MSKGNAVPQSYAAKREAKAAKVTKTNANTKSRNAKKREKKKEDTQGYRKPAVVIPKCRPGRPFRPDQVMSDQPATSQTPTAEDSPEIGEGNEPEMLAYKPKQIHALVNLPMTYWGDVTVEDLIESRRIRGSKITETVDEEHIREHFDEMRKAHFLFITDLSFKAMRITMVLALDPYVTLDRTHANYRFHILRILLKKLKPDVEITSYEEKFLRAGIEHNFYGQDWQYLHQFLIYFQNCPSNQRFAILTKKQRAKFRALEIAVACAWASGSWRDMGLDMKKLVFGMELLMPGLFAEKDAFGNDYDEELAWAPIQTHGPYPNANPPSWLDDAVFNEVYDEFVEEGMQGQGFGRGLTINPDGIIRMSGGKKAEAPLPSAAPQNEETLGVAEVQSELDDLVLNSHNQFTILAGVYDLAMELWEDENREKYSMFFEMGDNEKNKAAAKPMHPAGQSGYSAKHSFEIPTMRTTEMRLVESMKGLKKLDGSGMVVED